jgi:hypothetical protein
MWNKQNADPAAMPRPGSATHAESAKRGRAAQRSIVFLLATIYFLVDAIFMTVARPLSNWVAKHWIFESLRAWIVSLRPYPTLLLLAVPLIVLEPVKPVAAYLVGTGHVAMGMIVLVIGEILKLVLVERLFSISRDKLMSIPAFAWAYWKYRAVKHWMTSAEAWQAVRRWSRIAQYAIRSYVLELKASHRPRRITFQSR